MDLTNLKHVKERINKVGCRNLKLFVKANSGTSTGLYSLFSSEFYVPWSSGDSGVGLFI